MENVIEIPSKKNFSLEKVKLSKDGGIEATYEITVINDDECYVNRYAVKNVKDIHPDLKNLLNELCPIVGQVFGIKTTQWENVNVRGVTYAGKGENVGVVISSIVTASNGLKATINTPRLKLVSSSFGFEENLKATVEKIKSEVYAYLYEGKQAQLAIFGQAEPTNEMPDFE